MTENNIKEIMLDLGKNASMASHSVCTLKTKTKNDILLDASENLMKNRKKILDANRIDIEKNSSKLNSALLDRLLLDEDRIKSICKGLIDISKLEDPVGKILSKWSRPNGLNIEKVSVPLGVIGVIYESRGGSESFHSSSTIVNIINESYKKFDLPIGVLQNIPTIDRDAVGYLLKMDKYLDVIIPRGGKSLIERVSKESRVHVIKHLDGICHTYIEKSADKKVSCDVTVNAKMRRPGICGATETILCDEDIIKSHLPKIIEELKKVNCEIRGDNFICDLDDTIIKAKEEDWKTEYLDKIVSIKTIRNGVKEAVDHINNFGSGHTDAIISENKDSVEYFMKNIDSGIVMHNTSTQFADGGEFGMGAEIGISTSKVHARGPVGVGQLTSYKYKVRSNGQIRK